jgi:hypothetical protein
MRQFFYLVVVNYDECTFPQKVFLQELEATRWGRKEATKAEKEGALYEYVLYKQEITRTGKLERVKTLKPYPDM